MEKKRIDILLLEKEYASSRHRAQLMIEKGLVSVNGRAVTKASEQYFEDAQIEVAYEDTLFVSRAGEKLDSALTAFGTDLKNRVCIDIGASTGGFTDCMLKRGAAHVYSVDVGTDQLVDSLRNDSRVTVMENTNARYLTKDMFDRQIEFASIDVSFISLALIVPSLNVLGVTEFVALIKPQFEIGRQLLPKSGVVKSKKDHQYVLNSIITQINDAGYRLENLTYSPIRGQSGNIEFLGFFTKSTDPGRKTDIDIRKTVESAHEKL